MIKNITTKLMGHFQPAKLVCMKNVTKCNTFWANRLINTRLDR